MTIEENPDIQYVSIFGFECDHFFLSEKRKQTISLLHICLLSSHDEGHRRSVGSSLLCTATTSAVTVFRSCYDSHSTVDASLLTMGRNYHVSFCLHLLKSDCFSLPPSDIMIFLLSSARFEMFSQNYVFLGMILDESTSISTSFQFMDVILDPFFGRLNMKFLHHYQKATLK